MDDDEGSTTLADAPVRSARPAAATAARLTGDRYRTTRQIGRGGMGEVLEARDEQIGRDVAIKRMRAEAPSDNQIARFLREAKIQGQLEHPAIVPVHELGRDTDGRPYFAMKKLAGTTLANIIATGDVAKYPRQRLLRAFGDVCLAIELAHTRGIVHRDLKPDNLMLGDFGETYVLDWGVAKILGEADEAIAALGDADGHGTAAGSVIGTPGYMAPEQVRGDLDIDALVDVYSLGCVLFEILAGERLHPGGDAAMVSAIAGIDARPSVRAPDRDIPPELDALCVRATSVDRRNRVPSARELGDSVQSYLDGDRDFAVRRALATQHLDLALAAFSADDRLTAMREAGRALALDPTLDRAGELISRLMLEPPRVIPPEVLVEVERNSNDITRRNAKVGSIINLGFLLFIPIWFASGGVDPRFSLVFTLLTVGTSAYLWHAARPHVRFVVWPVIVMNALMIAMVGAVSSPFLLGIPLAAAAAVGITSGRFMTGAGALGLASVLSASVLGPWLAEQAGWLPISSSVADGVMAFHAPMFTNEAIVSLTFVIATVAVVFGTTVLARHGRVTERIARQHLHLQSWQLRHLFADPT